MDDPRFAIDWTSDVGQLAALEPKLQEVAARASQLAAGYNEPRNAKLMGHEHPISEFEVVDHYEAMFEEGARVFLLYRDAQLVGDADLRGIRNGTAEFAFMVAAPAEQGKGLGTKFALMVHAFAFRRLALHHVFASIVPENVASRRVFEKLGYIRDDGPVAREYADERDDIVMAIDRDTFEQLHAKQLREITIAPR
ncbi:MAG: protein N-acetyltransferase, RimJ/RimL family [Myxococcales bacterium]|nr:protein N-acetyltransferase, RimJ/RimL family [Myxococcales bacterium]